MESVIGISHGIHSMSQSINELNHALYEVIDDKKSKNRSDNFVKIFQILMKVCKYFTSSCQQQNIFREVGDFMNKEDNKHPQDDYMVDKKEMPFIPYGEIKLTHYKTKGEEEEEKEKIIKKRVKKDEKTVENSKKEKSIEQMIENSKKEKSIEQMIEDSKKENNMKKTIETPEEQNNKLVKNNNNETKNNNEVNGVKKI